MKKQFAIAIVAIMLLSVLVVPPVMSSELRDEITLQSIKTESETIDVDGKQSKLNRRIVISREDIIVEGGEARVSINGQLSGSGDYDEYVIWFAEGVEVSVEIDHSPSNVDVFLRINGKEETDRDHDGSASLSHVIPENGYHDIVVKAPDGGFGYDGWIRWEWGEEE